MKKKIGIFLMVSLLFAGTFAFLGCEEKLTYYTVIYDVQGGNSLPSIRYEKDTRIALQVPKKEGYFFFGWYYEPTYITRAGNTLTVTEDITIYARWLEQPFVVESGNGSIILRDDIIWSSTSRFRNTHDNYEAVPAAGYYFERWAYLSPDGTESANLDTIANGVDRRNVNIVARFGSTILAAHFTNDPSKLVDVQAPELIINQKGIANITTNELPAKKVEGTHLVKYVIAEPDAHITRIGIINPPASHSMETFAHLDTTVAYDYLDDEISGGFLINSITLNIADKSLVNIKQKMENGFLVYYFEDK
ncbi:MAG: InlB B-repeat-containing protein [Firmicutes bacterium]|nr:InlB B-repeat-containing protein [Bacillota bacterium]